MPRNEEYLDADQRVPIVVRQHCFNGLAGCVTQRRSRQTGTMVGVYRNDQAGLDATEPWSVVCEDHGHVVCFDTLKLAMYQLADPAGWCEVCARAALAKAERTTTSPDAG